MSYANPSPDVLATLTTLELLLAHLRLPAGIQEALHDLLGSAPDVDPAELAMLSEEDFTAAIEPLLPTAVQLTRSRIGYLWRYLQRLSGLQADSGQGAPLAPTAQAVEGVGDEAAPAFSVST